MNAGPRRDRSSARHRGIEYRGLPPLTPSPARTPDAAACQAARSSTVCAHDVRPTPSSARPSASPPPSGAPRTRTPSTPTPGTRRRPRTGRTGRSRWWSRPSRPSASRRTWPCGSTCTRASAGTAALVSREEAEKASFVLVATYARWKEVIRKQLDPTKGMMQNKLKLTKGHMPTMVKYVTVEQGARRVDHASPDPVPRRVRDVLAAAREPPRRVHAGPCGGPEARDGASPDGVKVV